MGFRSGNFVWRHVLHMGLSTGCRLPVAQAVAAAAVRCFGSGSTMGPGVVLYDRNLTCLRRKTKTTALLLIQNPLHLRLTWA
jgi:hypothetical protein